MSKVGFKLVIMGLIIKLLVTVLSLSMFFVKREQKMAIMLIYGICFTSIPARFLVPPFFFFLSEIIYWKDYFLAIKKFRLEYFVIILIVGVLVLIAHSPHLRGVGQLMTFLKLEILSKYLLILAPLATLKNMRNLPIIINATYYSVIILTIFGVLNLMVNHAIFVDWILDGVKLSDVMEDAGGKFELMERFRVQAMHFNPFDYGFICLAVWGFYLFLLMQNIVGKPRFLIISFCCMFGIVFCGCRTILVSSIVCFTCYYAFMHKLGDNLKWLSILIIVFFIVYFNIPEIENIINNKILSIVSDTSDVQGSSLAMRAIQLATTIYYIQGFYLFGRGYDFFNIDLGWNEGRSGSLDNDLQGLEGVYLNLLLERGVIGLLFYFIIMILLIKIFISYHKIDKNTSAFCLSLIITYLTFAIMTGELFSPYITFLFLGLGMKILYLKSQKKQIEYDI